MEDLIKVAEQAFNKTPEFPDFRPGDTISVAYKIIEGNKERIQAFEGVCTERKGGGVSETLRYAVPVPWIRAGRQVLG